MDTSDPLFDDDILFSNHSHQDPQQPEILKKFINMNSILTSLALTTYAHDFDTEMTLEVSYHNIHTLLRIRANEIQNRNRVEEDLNKSRSDVELLKNRLNRTIQEQDQKQRQLGQLENQLSIVQKQHRQNLEKVILEKEEFQKQIFKMQQKVTQAQVEVRKKEQEALKIKEQVKRNIDNKNQLVRNGFDIVGKLLAPQKPEVLYSNLQGWEGWLQIRKQLIDENFQQKETLDRIISSVQSFVEELYDLNRVPHLKNGIIYLPNNQNVCEVLQDYLNNLKRALNQNPSDSVANLSYVQQASSASKVNLSRQIEPGKIIQTNGFTLCGNKENDTKKPTRVRSQEKSSNRLTIPIKDRIVKKKPIDDIQNTFTTNLVTDRSEMQNLDCSLISRISFKDIPDCSELLESPKFKQKQQQARDSIKELKKWDFVFKN